MKQLQLLALALIALSAAACMPIQHDSDADAEQRVQEQREGVNIASWGTVEVSDGAWNKHFAVDGDSGTWWSADDLAPQWLEIDLKESYEVDRVEFSVSQVRPGPAKHEVTLVDSDGDIILKRELNRSLAADGDQFVLEVDPPLPVAGVRILAKLHEGWVAYREVSVFARAASFNMSGELLLDGLLQPVFLTHAGDGSGRLFVVEKEGRIRVVKSGILLDSPFLDISDRVSTTYHQGLLGLAFPSNYVEEGSFFVTYTSKDSQNVISRFSVSSDPDRADPASEETVLAFDQPGGTHTAGMIAFGPLDGHLYIAVGDGSVESDGRAAQETDSLLGKILRIDVGSDAGPYTVPHDNPFAGVPGYAPEIWALGLRNPWGMAFDRQTGDLFVSDSGENSREEVNFQRGDSKGGQNYGWPFWEGELCSQACELSNYSMPVATYDTHGREFGCAIVGGAVYRGRFVYADFCTGKVWTLEMKEDFEWNAVLWTQLGVPISSVGADEAGNIYAVGYATGSIYLLLVATSNLQ